MVLLVVHLAAPVIKCKNSFQTWQTRANIAIGVSNSRQTGTPNVCECACSLDRGCDWINRRNSLIVFTQMSNGEDVKGQVNFDFLPRNSSPPPGQSLPLRRKISQFQAFFPKGSRLQIIHQEFTDITTFL